MCPGHTQEFYHQMRGNGHGFVQGAHSSTHVLGEPRGWRVREAQGRLIFSSSDRPEVAPDPSHSAPLVASSPRDTPGPSSAREPGYDPRSNWARAQRKNAWKLEKKLARWELIVQEEIKLDPNRTC